MSKFKGIPSFYFNLKNDLANLNNNIQTTIFAMFGIIFKPGWNQLIQKSSFDITAKSFMPNNRPEERSCKKDIEEGNYNSHHFNISHCADFRCLLKQSELHYLPVLNLNLLIATISTKTLFQFDERCPVGNFIGSC